MPRYNAFAVKGIPQGNAAWKRYMSMSRNEILGLSRGVRTSANKPSGSSASTQKTVLPAAERMPVFGGGDTFTCSKRECYALVAVPMSVKDRDHVACGTCGKLYEMSLM